MPFTFKDKTGNRYGRLVAVSISHKTKFGYWWNCICDCGNGKVVLSSALGRGVNSCGCLLYESKNQTHGQTETRLYNIWRAMIQRCEDKNASNYERYGERGITICDEWRGSFINFYEWACSSGYSDELTIDRFPNKNGNYEPENCRWATYLQQGRNLNKNRMITYDGKTMCVSEWAEYLNVKAKGLYVRVYRGWTDEEVILGRPRKVLNGKYSKNYINKSYIKQK